MRDGAIIIPIPYGQFASLYMILALFRLHVHVFKYYSCKRCDME